jgi:PAS domain S-box-containing protein
MGIRGIYLRSYWQSIKDTIGLSARARRVRGFFALLLLLLLVGSVWLYRFQGRLIQSDVENELTTISQLKAVQISSWRVNQLAEANELSGSKLFIECIARWLSAHHLQDTSDILEQFKALQRHYRFSDILLINLDGQVLLSLSGASGLDHIKILPALKTAMLSGKSELSDLHTCNLNSNPHISVVAPLCIYSGRTKNPIGAVIMISEARDVLYPLMRMWPKASQSGETLLVRRDGNSVLYLSDLRFRRTASLTMRMSLSSTGIPAVQAVLGKKGIIYGTDYRGIEVVSAILPIADSNWFLVTKVDRAEAFAFGKLTSALILLLMVGLVVMAGSGELIAWQRNEKAHYQSLYESELAKRKSEERFKIAVESFGSVIFEWDFGQTIKWFGNIDGLMGYDEGEFPGTLEGWVDALHPDDRGSVLDALIRHVGGETSYDIDYRIRRKDGKYAYWASHGKLILDSSGKKTSWIGVITDITHRKQAENELRNLNENLVHSNKELEQFAYVVSHDLQEPLRTITSYTQLLAKRYEDRLDQDAQDFIRYIVDGAGRMQRLIQDLLSYARITTGASPFVSVDLSEAFEEAVANLHGAIAESAAVVTKNGLPKITADYRQMVQIIQNLIGNGIKFRKNGEPPHVHVFAKKMEEEWTISVRDNGMGIDPKYFDRIFVIFQRLHGKQEFPGNGIGLALCRKIMDRHGGRIWVESVPGEGSTFCFAIKA